MAENKILLTGLPLTGKTTFIAALWYMLYHHQVDSKLKLGSLAEGDHEYLNEMSDAWMRYEDMPRTSRYKLAGENVVINAVDNITNENIVLDIPDFSGETFKDHFDSRVWTEEFYNRIADTKGLMVFVNPSQRNNRPKLISMEQEYLRHMGAKKNNEGIDFTVYSPEYTPNQVKIVEELQFYRKYTGWDWPIKVAVMISAWDTIQKAPDTNKTPDDWLKWHMPHLYQFLKTNGDLFIVRYYGVSAQGGNYKKHREQIADLEAKDRIQLQIDQNFINDITEPIRWLAE